LVVLHLKWLLSVLMLTLVLVLTLTVVLLDQPVARVLV
jgi:hypothetical protein